jgi:glucans biosynthesis protein
VVSSGENGEILDQYVVPNEATGGRRMVIRLKRNDEHKPVELRAYLRGSAGTVSETWSYILPGD